MSQKNNPEVPAGSWPITKEDKANIRELGRELNKFLQAHFSTAGTVHIKVLAGAFQYVMDLQAQKAKVIGDDFIISQEVIVKYNLSGLVHEPFEDDPEPEAELPLEKPTEVEQATVVPTDQSNPDLGIVPEGKE